MDSDLRTRRRAGTASLVDRMRVGAVSLEAVRLAAYCGHAEARVVCPPPSMGLGMWLGDNPSAKDWEFWDSKRLFTMHEWLSHAERLIAELPGEWIWRRRCPSLHSASRYACDCSGWVEAGLPWTARLGVVGAVAAARAAWPWGCNRWDNRTNPDCYTVCPECAPALRAIEAAEAWLAEPTEERRRHILEVGHAGLVDPWVRLCEVVHGIARLDWRHVADLIAAFSDMAPGVREAVAAAWIAEVLG